MAEWRFQRLFTIMVTVKGPICNVIRIGCYLLSEVSAEPPTVYRIVSPAPMGQDHCSAESRICQSNALDKSGSWSIIITERFYRQAADLSYWLTYLEKQIAVTLAGAAILLLWCICRAKPRYISESKRCEAPDSATSASPPSQEASRFTVIVKPLRLIRANSL